MNRGQVAKLMTDGGLLISIAEEIRHEYFEEWQASKTIEDREEIHAKTRALELVIFKIEEKANETTKRNGTT